MPPVNLELFTGSGLKTDKSLFFARPYLFEIIPDDGDFAGKPFDPDMLQDHGCLYLWIVIYHLPDQIPVWIKL